ncbi:hypothetical protein [Metabacillus sp. Hm71]|uniref:hypothetical protein n=1 Tax=Metabacillus sp. Hm71 TaxID=3450743 RepID=UPI003F41C3B4
MPQETSQLMVRGGGRLSVRSHPGDDQGSYNILGCFFDKATTNPFRPGEAKWSDGRFLSNDEPDILQQEVAAGVTSADWFTDLRDPKKIWSFHVVNTNQGVFKVISAEPVQIPPDAIPD